MKYIILLSILLGAIVYLIIENDNSVSYMLLALNITINAVWDLSANEARKNKK